MFKHPPQKRGEQTLNPKRVRNPAEAKQPAQKKLGHPFNQRIFTPKPTNHTTRYGQPAPRRGNWHRLSDTLLSSQESDTHLCSTLWAGLRGNPSMLPASSLGVKLAIRPQGVRADPLGSAVSALRMLPDEPGCFGLLANPGTGLLRDAISRSAVASVPPCRADEENINRARARNTNPPSPGASKGGSRCVTTGSAPRCSSAGALRPCEPPRGCAVPA
jgi:hypothetical protein